ncbi:Uncharacterised protein [uncultured archaeon]|nr:Uncharacterised protein [uncultured archaeon]
MKSQLEKELTRFTTDQRKTIYENLFAIELTRGCSLMCDFCGVDAPRGVRESISFPVLETIAEEIVTMTDRISSQAKIPDASKSCLRLYDATEPLDYDSDGKNYFDSHRLLREKGFRVSVSSAIPKGKEELAISNLENIHQISISHMNRTRLTPYFDRLGIIVFFDLFSHYYAKFGSREYNKKAPIQNMIYPVSETVEKTLEELRKFDPSLPCQTRFYDLRVDGNSLRTKVQSADTLFLFCGNPGNYPRNGKIIDRDSSQVRNYGRAFDFGQEEREYPNDPTFPFSCDDGVKITPEGVYNILSVEPSQDHKSGRIIEKVNPKNFRVVKKNSPFKVYNIDKIYPFHCV